MKTSITPMSKVRMILKASERIGTCIDSFNRKHGIFAKPAVLEGGDILAIFAFIIVKLGFVDLQAHLQIANSFISENLQNSVSGYYITTTAGSLNAVLEINLLTHDHPK